MMGRFVSGTTQLTSKDPKSNCRYHLRSVSNVSSPHTHYCACPTDLHHRLGPSARDNELLFVPELPTYWFDIDRTRSDCTPHILLLDKEVRRSPFRCCVYGVKGDGGGVLIDRYCGPVSRRYHVGADDKQSPGLHSVSIPERMIVTFWNYMYHS